MELNTGVCRTYEEILWEDRTRPSEDTDSSDLRSSLDVQWRQPLSPREQIPTPSELQSEGRTASTVTVSGLGSEESSSGASEYQATEFFDGDVVHGARSTGTGTSGQRYR